MSPNPDTQGTTRGRPRLLLAIALLAGIAVLAVVGVLLFGGETPAAVGDGERAGAALDQAASGDGTGDALADESDADETDDQGDRGDGASAGPDGSTDGADGTWRVTTELEAYDLATSTGSFIGYRIDEELATIGVTQAVGRTPDVDGQVTVDGTSVTEAVVTGDLRQLVSDQPRRDGRVADALRVGDEPTVRFVADPIALPGELTDGGRLDVEVPGRLEAAGRTADVTAEVTVQRRGDVVVLTGSTSVALADLGITPPSAAIVVSVADTATIEWQLYLVR